MRLFHLVGFFVTALLMILVLTTDVALAQVPNSVNVTTTGTVSVTLITVDLDIGGTLPAEWIGWVVDRTTIGVCDQPTIQIGSRTPFPTGAQSYVLVDDSAVPGITYKYRIYAVDSAGTRSILPSYTLFSPGYKHFDYGAIENSGRVAEGLLVEAGWAIGIDLCADGCWEYLSSISDPPPEFVSLVGTAETIEIYGRLRCDFEGPYIAEITSWSFTAGCGPVPNDGTSWGGLKVIFR